MGGVISRKKQEDTDEAPPVVPERPELAQWSPPPLKNREMAMRVITLEDLKRLGTIPPKTAPEVQLLTAMGRRPVFLTYVSHTWADPEQGLPDNAGNAKCKAIIAALEDLKEKHLPEEAIMCIWIDCACLPQGAQMDGSGLAEALPLYMSKSNAVLSVVEGDGSTLSVVEGDGSARITEGGSGETEVDDDGNEREAALLEPLSEAIQNEDFDAEVWAGHWSRAQSRLDAILAKTISMEGCSHELREVPEWALKEGLPGRLHAVCGPGVPMELMKPMHNDWANRYPVLQGEASASSELEQLEHMLHEVYPSLMVGEYEGETDIEGRRDGTGTCVFAAGGRYEGVWAAGKPRGRGRYEFPWGDIYEGTLEDGSRHGEGTYIYSSGNKYAGNFEHNKRHGLGIYSYISGAKYEGAFAFDQRHGHGKYTFANGDVFEGDYIRGQMQGDGKLTQADGSVYVGPWKEGKMHGHGTFVFGNGGSRYIGEYQNGEMHGTGTYTFANGDVFRGEYVNGNMSKGTFLFVNGDRYNGEFSKGKMHGAGKFENAEGDLYDGEFANNLKHGAGIVLRSNGSRFEGTFKEGSKHGLGWYRTTDGNWFEGEWEHGTRCRTSERIPHPPYYESETGETGSRRPAAENLPAMDSTVSWDSVDIRTTRPDAQRPKDERKLKPPLPSPRGGSSRSYGGPTRYSRDGKRPGSAVQSRSGSHQKDPREQRKGPVYRQKHHLSVPDGAELDRYRRTHSSPGGRREPPSSASGAPGGWVQYANPRARIATASRYGVPTRLLNLLASEVEGLGANPFPDPAERIASIKSFAAIAPKSTQKGSNRPSSAPHLKSWTAQSEQPQLQNRSQRPRSALGLGIQPAPPQQKVLYPIPPVVDRATHQGPRLSGSHQSSLPMLSSPSPSISWQPVEYGKEVMNWREAAETDRWHPGIPMPCFPDEDAEAQMPDNVPFNDKMTSPGPYHRPYFASLNSIAESLR